MTSKQFKEAADLALNHPEIKLLDVDTSHFLGCGLPEYKTVFCTIREVAALIRWQCQYLCGGYDVEELQNMALIAKCKFQIYS